MAERSLPPFPGGDWRAWALQLVEYLARDTPRQEEVMPRAVILAHQLGGERATVDGIIMFSPTVGEVVYSKGGEWLKVSDNTPVAVAI